MYNFSQPMKRFLATAAAVLALAPAAHKTD